MTNRFFTQTIVSIWRENVHGYYPRTLSVPRGEHFSESVARGKLSFEEQIMSKDKYSSIFSRQLGAIVFIILQIFITTRKMGNIPQIFPSFSLGIFSHLTRLHQSRASKNIWWIIKPDMLRLCSPSQKFWRVFLSTRPYLLSTDDVKQGHPRLTWALWKCF